ncbi:hypothetical protein ACLD02_08770 [Alloalcanivorax sp. C16-2]|uniref:hypothetical protein n=1 Tax=Alloalcanivorax sp. C16-2 TaxID=3390052 RepID=UPI003970F12F
MKLLYLSEFVVGRPDGPGVNEFEFFNSLEAIADSVQPVFEKYKPENKKTKHEYLTRQISLFINLAVLYIKRKRYDVIVARSGPLPFLTVLASKMFKCPVYIKTVGDGRFSVLSSKKTLLHRTLFWLCRFLWKKLLKNTIAVDAVSDSHVASFSYEFSFPRENCYVIDNGVNTRRFNREKGNTCVGDEFFKEWKEKYNAIIGYVGGYPLQRGASELIELSHKFDEINLGILIVGGEKEEILDVVNSVGALNVYVTGQVDYESVPGYMVNMDIGVSLLDLSAWGASEQKLRQYISSGVVSICTQASNQELIEDGIVIPVDNTELKTVERAVEMALAWTKRENTQENMHEYAVEKLSIDARTKLRLEIIKEKITV